MHDSPLTRARLSLGVSLATLVTALSAQGARAQSVGALLAATHQAASATAVAATPSAAASSSATAMAVAAANALRYQTQVNSALNLAQQAQAAARAAAAALNQNQLKGIVDGLGVGGLQPAVTALTPASSDPTGLKTWEGASLPTVAATNANAVTVTQTQQNAVLSWTTFNVGQHTTLTFQQQSNGVTQPGWVVLNRVVGVLDPTTGLPLASSVAPSQILGSIDAPGTVLVLNQNGILFGPTSQVNVGSLVATSLEIGRAFDTISGVETPRSIAERNTEFLDFGILGYSEQNTNSSAPLTNFSSQIISGTNTGNYVYDASGAVEVAAGATLTSASTGYLALLAPNVTVAGQLTASDGEVALQSGGLVTLTASTGIATSADPDVRGLVVGATTAGNASADTVTVASTGIIQSDRGYVSIGSTGIGTVNDFGVIISTTSISENGYVNLFGPTINIGADAVIAIGPDAGAGTLPQDSTSLSQFKSSRVRIGAYTPGSSSANAYTAPSTTGALIDIGANSLIYAPGATISIGQDAGATTTIANQTVPNSNITVESGATIDAAGLTNVLIPASRNSIEINPVLGNELADSPAFRNGFLNGATVFLDPRISGVTANGVAYVGSPLIAAAAYAQDVGISVSELMVKGGSVTLGVSLGSPGATLAQTGVVDVKAGAVIDISGGWKTYQGGVVQETNLVDSNGQIIPISQANPDATYIGVYNGYQVNQPRWGVTQTFGDPLLTGAHTVAQYIEGQDAGSLTLAGSTLALDGQLFAGSVAGPRQILAATPGTASPSISGDQRKLQAAPSQLPSGGFLNIVGATDVTVDGAASYVPGISTTISLNADAISDAGLSQLSITTSGRLNVNADAALSLDPGGVFSATAGRTVTVDGSITTPSGSIAISTTGGFTGSIFSSEAPAVGFTDIVVDGTLNVAGRWANDLGAADGSLVGAAYLNGGTITLTPAAQQTLYPLTGSIATPNVDLSGSILLNPSSTLNLAGGGYVSSTGQFTLTAQGGNLNLVDTTNYYDLITGAHAVGANNPVFGLADSFYASPIPIPGSITSAVVVAGTILDAGFGGGGVFSLTVPSFSLAGSPQPSLLVGCNGCGATLSARFFSQAGFATYKITSNGTDLFKTVFDSAKGAFSGILATQVVEVGAGQQLSLTQSYFSPLLDTTQSAALKSLATGSSLYSVLTPTVPVDAWDEKAVSLSLGGLLELRVDAGGQIVGAPGSALTVSELYNAGTIRLPGGTITQSETNYATTNSVGVHALSDVFGAPLADGSYSQTAANVFFLAGNTYFGASNSQVAGQELGAPAPIYILGDLNVGEAVRLVPGSVTDLSGTAVVDPRATPTATFAGSTFTDGTVVAGGSFVADGAINGAAKGFDAQTGSILNLAGSQATYDRLTLVDGPVGSTPNVAYAPSLEWSNGGNLTLNQGGTITGAAIQAQGGAPLALGGQLNVLSPVLYQNDPASPTVNAISASGVTAAGFSTFIAQNTLTSVGDVTLVLPRAVFIENAPAATGSIAPTPIIGSGGALVIDAPYIAIQSATQTVSSPVVGTIGSNTLTLNATQIDITGAALFDQSIGAATLSATGDIRLIGTTPIGAAQNTPTLVGQLAANGDLTLASAQIYPTTGTTFTLSTTGVSSPTASKGGLITFKGGSVAPSTPYSAGGSLTVLAANIVQSGVVRAPLGALTLGSNSASTIAPATASLTLAAGSTTSVSADGLDIPYGTTTDQVEWYFTPTQGAALTAPPAGVLHLAGGAISAASGATIDLKGGGDVYAYEFVAGTGGSRDVLNQLNPDPFSSNNGYQYPDGRQVYAIVPGLSSAAAAALDPLYSANYGSLYGPSQAGLTVTLSAAPGLAAGTYTLLPAQYALLPGGMRVVQDPAAGTPAVNAAGAGASVVISDGSILTPGYFGVAGANTRSSTPVVFEVQSQTIVRSESDIAQTFGNEYFTAQAASSGVPTPQLPIDAGRLILDPVTALALGAAFETTPANLAATASEPALTGRGANVDISGTALVIDDPLRPVTAATGQIVLADSDLADLGAASLFLGGTRTDGSDGTTTLHVSSNTIDVAAGATLSAPEILFAVDGKSSKITVAGGAAIEATGAAPGGSTQNYIFASGTAANGKPAPEGGFLRVSDGPQRLLTRPVGATVGSIVIGGGPQRATLSGASIALNSPATLTIAANTRILDATAIALAARSITVGQSGAGLVITPALQTLLSNTPSVTLAGRTGIGFAAGSYAFQTLTLDTPALTAIGSGAVAINVSSDLSIGSTSALTRACGGAGAFACGTGSFAITAKEIAFQSGTIRTYGSGGGVTLIAPMGTFADGSATLNVGAAPLTIDTPFIGDRGTGLAGAVQPSLTLTTTGSASFDSATPASAFTAPAGTPGSTLAINAASVSIVGTELRATAGTLTVTSASGIAISGGALLASPSYAKTFGDSADSTTVSAPGGTLSLVATTGDIAISDDSTLAVGGTQGQSGLISISAQNGSAYAYHGSTSDVVGLAAVLSAQGGGGSLTLNSNGAFDLTAFAAGSGQQFTGAIDVHTGTGDLTLAAGDVLTATSVTLTADGGQIDQAGKIDTSGSSGGDVSLYGETGVDLASTAVIDSRATGFGATSTQQAAGGNVILGVDGAGALAVDAGAVIDVSAVNTGNRLVNMNRTNGTYYTFVAGDVGGTLTLRAPVINPGGLETMNVSFGGAVDGASSVLLDGFRRFRLAGIASTPGYVGVSISGDTATLDLTATAPRSANALSSTNGFVVQFVQNFDVSSIYGALGGLASAPNFHARPEVELDYLGNIVLASNWNLGAGVVNVSGAVAAGLMAADPGLPGQYYVVGANAQALATNEGLILADYTRATYHVGGSFAAEPGILTIRAGRDLTLNGSITDGFFQFADQTDPNYLDQVLGGGNRTYQANLAPTTDGTSVTINFPGKTGLLDPGFNAATGATGVSAVGAYVLPSAPYSAAANSAAALGDQPVAGGALVTGTGDPLGSAQLFPLLPSPDGGSTAIASWSYRLVSGAALFAPGSTSTFQPSANPLDIVTGAKGNIVVQGQNVYGYQAVIGAGSFGPDLDLLDSNQASLAPSAWLSAYETQNGLTDSAPTTISFTLSSVRDEIDALETQFAAMNPTDTITVSKNGSITTSLSTAAQFLNYIDSSNSFSQIAANYSAPSEAGISAPIVYATAPTRVRTGTGSISMVASGTIDLRNGDQTLGRRTGLPTEVPLTLTSGGKLVAAGAKALHLGGAAVYTAGATANLGVVSATDVATGAVYSVDLAANAVSSDNLADQTKVIADINGNPRVVAGAYTYGGGTSLGVLAVRSGFAGILIADPVYSDGGGDVTLKAGLDVLSRRDTVLENELGGFGTPSTNLSAFTGVGDQPWRTGILGGNGGAVGLVNLLTDPQLFAEGVGTLGGGNITIDAGRTVSDLSTVASDSITTATVGAPAGGAQPLALVNLSYGNVSISAGGSVLGGRLDVAAGDATLKSGGSITTAGQVDEGPGAGLIPNELRIRLSDGTATLEAAGAAIVESIGALGLNDSGDAYNSQGFYAAGSGVSILADGAVTVTNNNLEAGLLIGSGPRNIYPGSLEAVSFTGNVSLLPTSAGAQGDLLYPDATGTLTLLAAGDIMPVSIAQLDSDPTLLPGVFSNFIPSNGSTTAAASGLYFGFPAVLPDTLDPQLRLLHNPSPTNADDPTPNRIVAGGDIDGAILSTAKQTRIAAGRDIIDMVLLGQNLNASDITRVTAGRDITATTALDSVTVGGAALPTVQGNTFILGGPGSLFIEAGRNAGPFLNSAVSSVDANGASAPQSYGGGIIAVGNLWNPFLPAQSADIYTEFGVANGQNFAGLISTYLDPSNFASQPGYLFIQQTNSAGIQVPDRTKEDYSLSLVQWMTSVAGTLIDRYDTAQHISAPSANAPALIQFLRNLQNGGTATTAQALAYLPQLSGQTLPLIPWLQLNEAAALTNAYGTLDVTYAQAFAMFQSLPTLTQRQFLIKDVYFNELVQTSIPTSPSYLKYSRGYLAVNTLFPASSGYTANSLNGGPAGASTTVQTGNLDLRLSTIQTDQGGDIAILGPGGRVLAGSVVSTAVQSTRRYYAGAELYQGNPATSVHAAVISAIPSGYEGILTLKGGSIDSFTDQDFLLNQSRAFTEEGGDIAIWSSNTNVNAGQGPRTTADVAPAVVHIDEDAYSLIDTNASVSGAGIGAFNADASGLSPDVFLIAPRGTVDAGAAGVRSSGNVFIAAFQVANADAIQAGGTISGAGAPAAVNVASQTSGDAAATAAAQAAQAAGASGDQFDRPVIVVDVLGFLPDEKDLCKPQDLQDGKCR